MPSQSRRTRRSDADTRSVRRGWALTMYLLVSVACGILVAGLALPALLVGTVVYHSAGSWWGSIDNTPPDDTVPQRSHMLDRNGNVIATWYDLNRQPVAANQIPQVMKNAQVSIEDTRFYEHGALDPKGFARALVHGGSAGGGSSITQQYVKNLRLYNADNTSGQEEATAHTLGRKLQELRMAMHLEQTMTKDQILAGYLNTVAFGDGTYGVEAASEHYFGHPASQLSLPEAALLAGIVQQPTALNPALHPKASRDKRNIVLSDMLKAHRISQAQFTAAAAAPVTLHVTRQQNGCLDSTYPFFCLQVMSELHAIPSMGATDAARTAAIHRGGLTIKTTLDPRAMRAATNAARSALGNDNQFAAGIAIVQPGTGQVVGIGQNRTVKQTSLVYATSGFQNGSTFKPVTLAAALQDGFNINERMYAPPTFYAGGMNFHNQSAHDAGTMTAGDAIAMSSNTFFVKLETQRTTIAHTQDMARKLGWDIPQDKLLASTTLGVFDVSPVTVANAYATFAAHGTYCTPTWILSMSNSRGRLAQPEGQCHQVMERHIADDVDRALLQTIGGSNPNRTGAKLGIGRPALGKTGTTENNAAVWFAGGTPQYTSAVWVGDPRGGGSHPVNTIRMYGSYTSDVFGATTAGPIWQQTMTSVMNGLPVKSFNLD